MKIGEAASTGIIDAVVVGAGFAGLYALHRLRQRGLTTRVFETGSDVGGTWYWNRYPGARCDAQSLVYSYTFDERLIRDWRWSENYATQGEILAYLRFVADRLDLRRDIQFDTKVTAAHYDAERELWQVTCADGGTAACRYLVFAAGALSAGYVPSIEGLDLYQGRFYHTGNWPHEGVDFTGLDVGVIGTGSSGVQVIPLVAEQARSLHVFQRTANFVLPARNKLLADEHGARFVEQFASFRSRLQWGEMSGIGDVLLDEGAPPTVPRASSVSSEDCRELLEARWQVGGVNIWRAFAEIGTDSDTNELVCEFVRGKIREIVDDPAVADALTPRGYPFGSKRPCVGTDYYETYNRPNVRLIDLKNEALVGFNADGIVTSAAQYPLDCVVFATGYDAVTGALSRVDIRGRGEVALRDLWASGARSYLGLAVAGFPNMFTITGPGSPSILGNVVVNIEQHVEWIDRLIAHAEANGLTVEAEIDAQTEWVTRVRESAKTSIMSKAKSWYVGANIAGKPQEFLPWGGGIAAYRRICDEIEAAGYPGFAFGSAKPGGKFPDSDLCKEGSHG